MLLSTLTRAPFRARQPARCSSHNSLPLNFFARRARVKGEQWHTVELSVRHGRTKNVSALVKEVLGSAVLAGTSRAFLVQPAGRVPTPEEEQAALGMPLNLLDPLPQPGAYVLVEQVDADRINVRLRARPGAPPVTPELRPRLTAGGLRELLTTYNAAGVSCSPDGPLLDGLGALSDGGCYYLVGENAVSPETRVAKLEACNQNEAVVMERAATERVAAELRAMGRCNVRVLPEKLFLGPRRLECDGVVLADGCAAIVEAGAVLTESKAKQLRDRLNEVRREAPDVLAGRRVVGVLAGGFVAPIVPGFEAAELAAEWAERGYGLLLPNGSDFSFGDGCFKSATLTWPLTALDDAA